MLKIIFILDDRAITALKCMLPTQRLIAHVFLWTWSTFYILWWAINILPFDLNHKSHNAPNAKYHNALFRTEMCTFLFWNGALWDIDLVHCEICETVLLGIQEQSSKKLVIEYHNSMIVDILAPCAAIPITHMILTGWNMHVLFFHGNEYLHLSTGSVII